MTNSFDNEQYVLYEGQAFGIEQSERFADWLRGLRDRRARSRILERVRRLADGNPGDVKSVGDGVHELRLHFGPGYRVYFIYRNDVVVLLLAGGDKGSQERDVAAAKHLAELERDAHQENGL